MLNVQNYILKLILKNYTLTLVIPINWCHKKKEVFLSHTGLCVK